MSDHLLDANVLIAAFDENHMDHERASKFFQQLGFFYTCPLSQGAFLRFFTRPWTDNAGIRHEPRMATNEAIARLRAILNLSGHRFLSDDLPFDRVSMRSLSGFKQWNDAYLLALSRKHRLKFCTLERKLENMDDPPNGILVFIP
jgi:predicted nucleic acid-binding protein